MQDAKLFEIIALVHIARRLFPLVQLPRDVPGLVLATTGFSVTLMATARLGFVRTYFGSEFDWFPYGYIPHPMIVGQLVAFGSILYWWYVALNTENIALLATLMGFYTLHMIQEIVCSSY